MKLISTRGFPLIPLIMSLCMSLCIAAPVFADNEPTPTQPSGTGTSEDPYLISSLENLYWITQNSASWDKYFKQTANITLTDCSDWDSAAGWTPIGNRTTKFTGSYDGDSHTINGLYINRSANDQGFFGVTRAPSSIQNLGLVNVNISVTNPDSILAGALAAELEGSINNCFVTGTVSAGIGAGGLVGLNNSGTISSCYTAVDVWGDDVAGGLAASNYGTITNCYNTGDVTRISSGSSDYFGAFCGNGGGIMQYSYSIGGVFYDGADPTDKGFVGIDDYGTYTGNFFDNQTSNQTTGYGATAKTTAQMKTQTTFTGWDFDDVWAMSSLITFNGYPTLQWTNGYAVAPESNQIATLPNLVWVAEDNTRWAASYTQTANINMWTTASWDDGAGWTPIGNDTTKFLGSYDGQGYIITGLRIDRPDTGNVGLFGHVGYDAGGVEIKNLGLIDVEIVGGRGSGTLVGRVTGSISTKIMNCYASRGSVVGDGATGGLVGSSNSYVTNPGNRQQHPTISKCFANIDVSWSRKTTSGADKFGGLVGCTQRGYVYNSYARGSVTIDNNPQVFNGNTGIIPDRIGGLAGCILNWGDIEYSYSTGAVITDGTIGSVGGFVASGGGGSENGDTVACFWDTQTSGRLTSSPATGCTGETTENMTKLTTFTDYGWSTDIWAIDANVNNGYPYLKPTQLLVELAAFTGTPTQNGILLEWETASEIDHAGFHIWRSGSAEGTYTQITDALIPAQGGPSMGATYAYEDGNVEAGATYFYQLEDIDTAGVSTSHGPVSAWVGVANIQAGNGDGLSMATEGEPVFVKVAVQAGDHAGTPVEYWVAAHTPFGWYSYGAKGWKPGIAPAAVGPLADVAPLEVVNFPLPSGWYTFYLAVDDKIDGQPDLTWMDSVEVEVE
jgi:hypothetical protein